MALCIPKEKPVHFSSGSPEKITVLHLCEHFGGRSASLHGVARMFLWSLPLFDPARFRVLLCSRKGPDKAFEQMKAGGLSPLFLGYGKMDPRNLWKLLGLMKTERVDILHAHGYGACLWGRLAGMMRAKPVIVHERCNYGTVPWFQRPVERWLGPRTKYALAVSESTRRFTAEKRHIPAEAIEVVYNGICLDKVERVSQEWRAAFRREQGADPQTTVLGIVGRLESHKGHVDAFEAFAEVLKKRPDAQLWVVGDGAYEPELKRWVREHGLDSSIRFLGFRRAAIQVIQCLDIQIFPSHQEGTPNTLYESMAVGNAAVASTADGQGEILDHEKTALLFAPGDSGAMAGHILRLLNDPALAAALRKTSLERIRDFDGRATVRKLEDLYTRILRETGRGRSHD